MNYFEHFEQALAAWMEHYEFCAARNDQNSDNQERQWAKESFEQCEQIKILQDGTIKIKWEHGCWWADCQSHVFHGEYYCILAPADKITWYFPFGLAKRGDDE